MAMSVVYATVNGRLVQENRGGVITRYVADTLGSVIQTRDVAGNQTSSTTYWPFGEVRTHSGTNPSPWGFCGTLGYYTDAAGRLYVRERSLRTELARWLTVDAYWPSLAPYQYAFSNPISYTDASGMFPTPDCSGMSDCLKKTPKCGGTKPVSITMMLCVFWQETSFGHETPPGGIGRCTEPCFKTLHGKGCFKKFKDYDDFCEERYRL